MVVCQHRARIPLVCAFEREFTPYLKAFGTTIGYGLGKGGKEELGFTSDRVITITTVSSSKQRDIDCARRLGDKASRSLPEKVPFTMCRRAC